MLFYNFLKGKKYSMAFFLSLADVASQIGDRYSLKYCLKGHSTSKKSSSQPSKLKSALNGKKFFHLKDDSIGQGNKIGFGLAVFLSQRPF